MAEPGAGLPVRRHDLAWIDPQAWPSILATSPIQTGAPQVAGWAERGWPLIVRRRACKDDPALIPLGLPLPPAHGKQRLAFQAPAAALTHVTAPLALAAVRASAPATWQATIDQLLDLDPGVRTFGGLAWSGLTGLAYLSAASDLDLIWRHQGADRTQTALEAIAAIDQAAPMRIDGEWIAADGAAVNWRELGSMADQVLVKTMDEARLSPRAAFMALEARL